jgi:hypothetical protein
MMKDWYPDPYSSVLPRCPVSAKCIQRIDEIDALGQQTSSGWTLADYVESIQEKEYVEYLVRHLQYCSICQMAVGNERRLRDQQQQMVRNFLASEEKKVPSVTSAILASLNDDRSPYLQLMREIYPRADAPVPQIEEQRITFLAHHRAQHAPKWSVTSALAVIVIMVLASLHMFAQFGGSTLQAPSTVRNMPESKIFTTVTTVDPITVHASTSLRTTNTWSSVILTHWSQDGRQLIVENYNPTNKKSMQLLSTSENTTIDNVSHRGDNLIYHTYDSVRQETRYSLLSGEQYDIGGHGLNAVWSTDDTMIFLATSAGIIWKVDVNDPVTPLTELFSGIQVGRLAFYRNHFLYYVRGQSLYRIDVDSSQQQEQAIVPNAASNVFWMDPNSEDIYYIKNHGAQHEMYKHQENTPSSQDLALHTIGTPVGYAQESSGNWSLMYINWNQATGGFDLQKIASKKPVYQNIVGGKTQSLCNVAAASGSICDNSLAMSPSGTLLTVGRVHGTLNYQLWSIDFVKKETTSLPMLSGRGPIQLIGWDKWLVS